MQPAQVGHAAELHTLGAAWTRKVNLRHRLRAAPTPLYITGACVATPLHLTLLASALVIAAGGSYASVLDALGKFFVTIDEPFDGRVTGIAKTECRQIPLEVSTPMEIAIKADASGAPQDVQLILVEDTAD